MTILVVDDRPEDRTAARIFLTEAGQLEGLRFKFSENATGESALAAVRSTAPDCILLDYYLPDMDALEFLHLLREKSGETPVPVVVFTGIAKRDLASAALRAGAQEYLPKRLMSPEMLLRAIESARDRFKLHAERRIVTDELARLNGELERRVNERTAALVEESARRLEAETLLHQAQKMEAIGQLTGGLAHDFNNLLQVITGNLEMVLRRLPPHTPAADPATLRRPVENARRAAKNAADLTQRLLAFGRRQILAPTMLEVNDLVAGLSEMISQTLGETINVVALPGNDLWPVFADANQLEAALLNLIVNARDAMPAGGRLTVETANVNLDGSYPLPLGDVPPGAYVLLSITDSGAGIREDVLGRVFEPFFTTKPFGQGTGLGLAMVYGFVRQSKGHIGISSEVGEGTTVKIYLPRYDGSALEVVTSSPPPVLTGGRNLLPAARSGGTILLVEDEEQVHNVVQEALEDLGYRVLTTTNAAEAIALLEARGRAGVDLLFTDIVIPGGMDGLALAKTAAEHWPWLPVLITTGFSPNAVIDDISLDARFHIIGKPFSFDLLARQIRECLDGVQGSTGP